MGTEAEQCWYCGAPSEWPCQRPFLDVPCRMNKLNQNEETTMETMIQPKITGYRQLTEAEAALMNEGKALAEQCGAYIAKLRENKTLDQRWVSIGATDLQQGFMSVIRAIAQPTTF